MFEAECSKKAALNRELFSTNGRLEASVSAAGAMLDRVRSTSFGQQLDYTGDRLGQGDVAILKFLAAIELIESDLWQQYDELGGTTTKAQSNYQLALQFLDRNASKFITANTANEIEQSAFLRTSLESEGVEPLNLDEFRILRGSTATGSKNIHRLTNLRHLNNETNRYPPRCRNDRPGVLEDAHMANRPAIPCADSELGDTSHVQVLANTAAFHFRYIERGVSSLYTSLSQRVKRVKVLKIMLGIGGQEIAHFLQWLTVASNVLHDQPSNLDHSATSRSNQETKFHDTEIASRRFFFQTSPKFSSRGTSNRKDFPLNPDIRPANDHFGSAVATIHSFTQNGLFFGQSAKFLRTLMALAEEADAAVTG